MIVQKNVRVEMCGDGHTVNPASGNFLSAKIICYIMVCECTCHYYNYTYCELILSNI